MKQLWEQILNDYYVCRDDVYCICNCSREFEILWKNSGNLIAELAKEFLSVIALREDFTISGGMDDMLFRPAKPVCPEAYASVMRDIRIKFLNWCIQNDKTI